MTLNGIDVSNVNGPVDWEAWRGKIGFAGVKVSEGLNFTDRNAEVNIRGARSIGAVPMAYHFLRANLPGISQARFFLARALAAGISHGDLLMIDVETMDGMSAAQVSECAAAFAGEVHAQAGIWPVAYTDQSFALGGCVAALGVCPAFIANPSRVVLPVPLGPWRLVSFEQTGQRGIDTDVFYGTAEQLAALALPHPKAPAPAPAPQPTGWTEKIMQQLPVLALGATGTHVRTAQFQLREKGRTEVAVDGDYGPVTRDAVLAVQADRHLTQDGTVGAATWSVLLGVA